MLRFIPQCNQGSHDLDGLYHAGPIIMRPFIHIPAIQVTTNCNEFIRELAAG